MWGPVTEKISERSPDALSFYPMTARPTPESYVAIVEGSGDSDRVWLAVGGSIESRFQPCQQSPCQFLALGSPLALTRSSGDLAAVFAVAGPCDSQRHSVRSQSLGRPPDNGGCSSPNNTAGVLIERLQAKTIRYGRSFQDPAPSSQGHLNKLPDHRCVQARLASACLAWHCGGVGFPLQAFGR